MSEIVNNRAKHRYELAVDGHHEAPGREVGAEKNAVRERAAGAARRKLERRERGVDAWVGVRSHVLKSKPVTDLQPMVFISHDVDQMLGQQALSFSAEPRGLQQLRTADRDDVLIEQSL